MLSTNLEQARFNMIEQQIRPAEVLDPRVLDTIAAMPRDQFVPEAYRELAYADINIPLGNGEQMMKPIMEARLLQALDVQPTDKVLEIGTGSGYVTALLAKLGQQVDSVDINPEFLAQAKARLDAQGIGNVSLQEGDAAHGWEQNGPYDVIAITGALPVLPSTFQQQLAVNGRMVVITGTAPVMEVQLITRTSEGQWTSENLFETEFPALQGAEQPQAFVF